MHHCSSCSGGLRRIADLGRVVFEQRTSRHIRDLETVALREILHLARARRVLVEHTGELRRVIGQQLDPQVLFDAGRERVRAGQYEVDVGASRGLHRLDLAGQLRRRSVRERDVRNEIRILRLERLEALLRELKIAGHVDDVDRDRIGRVRGKSERRTRGDTDGYQLERQPVRNSHCVSSPLGMEARWSMCCMRAVSFYQGNIAKRNSRCQANSREREAWSKVARLT
ncbi:hypothetical protein QF002_008020 [Paraburkholderia youngii]